MLRTVQKSCGPIEPSSESMTVTHEVHTCAALLQQADLRLQHPEWILPNGECPMCDSYEARLIKLLDASLPGESNENALAVIFS